MNHTYDVYGVGNAIMDIQVRCEDAFLENNGIEKGIMTLVEEHRQSDILNALSDHRVHYCSGGSAANTIVGIRDFGGKVAYAGKTGADDYGHRYLNEMRDMGVAIEVETRSGQTGTCVVLVTPDAQRSMLTHLGVSNTLAVTDIDASEIARAQYLYVEGYLFAGDDTRAAALHAIAVAKQAGVKVALTISDPFLIHICKDLFWQLIRGPVDLLFCNQEEAKALTGLEDPIECAREIHQYATNVALTLGANGSLLMHENQLIPIEGVKTNAIDTTGAGDMYAAGVLYGITNGLSWKQAGHLGSHAAARIVAQLGARMQQCFTQEEITQLLN
ncbi:MAG: adenosine kinase [Zetaproteobacteria bacterium]|nr:adenosine kinase [Zetaproteobacteria bacterium]